MQNYELLDDDLSSLLLSPLSSPFEFDPLSHKISANVGEFDNEVRDKSLMEQSVSLIPRQVLGREQKFNFLCLAQQEYQQKMQLQEPQQPRKQDPDFQDVLGFGSKSELIVSRSLELSDAKHFPRGSVPDVSTSYDTQMSVNQNSDVDQNTSNADTVTRQIQFLQSQVNGVRNQVLSSLAQSHPELLSSFRSLPVSLPAFDLSHISNPMNLALEPPTSPVPPEQQPVVVSHLWLQQVLEVLNNQKMLISQLMTVCNNRLGLGLGHGSRFGTSGGRGTDDNTLDPTGIKLPRLPSEQGIFTPETLNSPTLPSPTHPSPTLPSPRKKKQGNFICAVQDCNCTFPNQLSLKRHMKKHTGDKFYLP